MRNKLLRLANQKNIQVFALAIVGMIGSFSLGIQSAGDVRPVSLIEAGSIQQSGDMNGNGQVDSGDVKIILEIAQGYRSATPQQLLADPSGDGKITIDDAIRLLNRL